MMEFFLCFVTLIITRMFIQAAQALKRREEEFVAEYSPELALPALVKFKEKEDTRMAPKREVIRQLKDNAYFDDGN